MKKSRFADSQIMSVLTRVEAVVTVPELSRGCNVSVTALYKWGAKYGSMDTSMIKRLKELEVESARLSLTPQTTSHTLAQHGHLVTFGIEPNETEAGFRYIEAGETMQ